MVLSIAIIVFNYFRIATKIGGELARTYIQPRPKFQSRSTIGCRLLSDLSNHIAWPADRFLHMVLSIEICVLNSVRMATKIGRELAGTYI